MVKEETLPKGFVSEYISLDTKSYNAIKQAYRKLSKSSDRSIGVVCSGGGGVMLLGDRFWM